MQKEFGFLGGMNFQKGYLQNKKISVYFTHVFMNIFDSTKASVSSKGLADAFFM